MLTIKNLRLLVRAKSSALIVFLAPLLIILILGLSYNSTSQYGLTLGVYSGSQTDDVTSFMESLRTQEFQVIPYTSSIDNCVEDIKNGAVHACILLPESFAIEGNEQKEITFYLDPSRINLVSVVQDALQSEFNFRSQQISQELTQNLLSALNSAKGTLGEKNAQLAAIREQSSSALGSVQSAQSGLEGVDVSAPAAVYDTSILDNVSSSITSAIAGISNALDNTNSSDVESPLRTADTRLDTALALVNGQGTTTLAGIIANLQVDVQVANAKLTAAAETIGSSSSSLASAQSILAESAAALESVQAGLGETQTALESLPVTEAGTIAAPLVTKIERVGDESTYLNYGFPTLLVLVIMFSSLLLGTILVMMEKNSPSFLRNFFLPVRKVSFIISTYLTTIILIIVQIVVILGISLFFLQDILSSLPSTALVLFLAASVFTFLGMSMGYIFTSEETGVLASISLGSIFLFVSGVVLPLEIISPWLRSITSFSPFVITEKLIRETMIFNTSLLANVADLALLLGYAVILFAAVLLAESLLHKNLVNKFMKHHHHIHRQRDKQRKNDV